jgi:hypothetical protein
MSLKDKLDKLISNGVVSLKDVKNYNYPLYKTITHPDSANLVRDMEIINDIHRLNTEDDVKKFLQFKFGNEVDITTLRKHYMSVYKNINTRGNVKEVIEGWGFRVVYSYRDTSNKLTKELLKATSLNKTLYDRLYRESEKRGMKVKELLKELGFEVKEVSVDYVHYLKDIEGFSYGEIATYLNISKTQAHRLYRR